jgi:hypothetical protein
MLIAMRDRLYLLEVATLRRRLQLMSDSYVSPCGRS